MQANISLKDYTTMRLGGPARALATATNKQELVSLIEQADKQSIPLRVLGAGSNVIVTDEGFNGLVILNRMTGFKIIQDKDPDFTTIKVGGGEIWDSVVQKSVDLDLSGIENLSAIPGYVGAAPIQNIGAYGQEVADTIFELEAYDLQDKKFVTLAGNDCDFTYRQSIFNTSAKGRYVIVSITLQLFKRHLEPPFYGRLQQYLDDHHTTDYSPQTLRQAVCAIRAIRLPDPAKLPNAGSFFKNPIVEKWRADQLSQEYADVQFFPMGGDLFKLPAGWLIEQSGLKGLEMDGMKVYDRNALVLVNQSATSYAQLAAMREHIINAVHDKFFITLTQEPEEINPS